MPEMNEPMSEGIDPERLEYWRRVSEQNYRAILRAVGMPERLDRMDGSQVNFSDAKRLRASWMRRHHIDPDQKGDKE